MSNFPTGSAKTFALIHIQGTIYATFADVPQTIKPNSLTKVITYGAPIFVSEPKVISPTPFQKLISYATFVVSFGTDVEVGPVTPLSKVITYGTPLITLAASDNELFPTSLTKFITYGVLVVDLGAEQTIAATPLARTITYGGPVLTFGVDQSVFPTPLSRLITYGAPSVGVSGPVSHEDILNEMEGFAAFAGTTGGAGGPVVTVTNLNNSGSGSLRDAVSGSSAKWVRFSQGLTGTINLSTDIPVGSNTTIDGRGANITISGQALDMNTKTNIVITHIKAGGNSNDAFRIIDSTTKVWINHCEFSPVGDGMLDITVQSDNITVSWCQFNGDDKAMLISHSDTATSDNGKQVTLHHNYWNSSAERCPRIRFYNVHMYNNYVYDWGLYGTRVAIQADLRCENCIYEATAGSNAGNAIQLLNSGYSLRTSGLYLLGGASVPGDTGSTFTIPYSYNLETANDTLKASIIANAGWQNIPFPS